MVEREEEEEQGHLHYGVYTAKGGSVRVRAAEKCEQIGVGIGRIREVGDHFEV